MSSEKGENCRGLGNYLHLEYLAVNILLKRLSGQDSYIFYYGGDLFFQSGIIQMVVREDLYRVWK